MLENVDELCVVFVGMMTELVAGDGEDGEVITEFVAQGIHWCPSSDPTRQCRGAHGDMAKRETRGA